MCLLIVCSHVIRGYPLVVAANRDERLDRPATTITVLREDAPRILGGRDEVAGGTWLAVNDEGVVAGLTNRRSSLGRDPARRSRGELPLAVASASSAKNGVKGLVATVQPADYNAAWMLAGDRSALYYLELDGSSPARARAREPGIHVLENLAIDAASTKVDRARELLGDPSRLSVDAILERLTSVLADHYVAEPGDPNATVEGLSGPSRRPACVHGDAYGTRSSMIVLVPDEGKPRVYVADGRPCETAFTEETSRWFAEATTDGRSSRQSDR
jgi:uncharacterized protein with NRDE domain